MIYLFIFIIQSVITETRNNQFLEPNVPSSILTVMTCNRLGLGITLCLVTMITITQYNVIVYHHLPSLVMIKIFEKKLSTFEFIQYIKIVNNYPNY